jgi:cytochrome c
MYTQLLNLMTKEVAPCVKRNLDGAVIPFDPANMDFVEYNKWLSEGNQPLPPDAEKNL